MNLQEAFVFKSGNRISSTDAITVLEFNGLTPTDTWDPENATQRCKFYGALIGYLDQDGAGIASESEGGYSKSYDHAGKAAYLSRLAQESKCPHLIDKYNDQPAIEDRSELW